MKLISRRASIRIFGKTMMAVFLLFALTADVNASGDSVGDVSGEKSVLSDSGGSPDGGNIAGEERFERFGDFTVPMKDVHGGARILVCTLIVELQGGANLPEERCGLRKIIYGTLQERSGTADMKKGLRKVIKERLNIALRGHTIRNVYFTKFVLL